MFGANPGAWLALHRQERDQLERAARAPRHPRRLPSLDRLLPSPAPVASPAPVCASC